MGADLVCTSKALEPVFPGDTTLALAAVSGTWTVQEVRPHSKSPLGTRPRAGQGVAVGVGVQVGPQPHADRYLAGVVPQAAVARVG